jgi:hypothetical protein
MKWQAAKHLVARRQRQRKLLRLAAAALPAAISQLRQPGVSLAWQYWRLAAMAMAAALAGVAAPASAEKRYGSKARWRGEAAKMAAW